jgi:hypothetical protein
VYHNQLSSNNSEIVKKWIADAGVLVAPVGKHDLPMAGCKQSFKNIDLDRWGERRIEQKNVRQVRNPDESVSMAK